MAENEFNIHVQQGLRQVVSFSVWSYFAMFVDSSGILWEYQCKGVVKLEYGVDLPQFAIRTCVSGRFPSCSFSIVATYIVNH